MRIIFDFPKIMKTHRIFILVLLSSILINSGLSQTTLLQLNFDDSFFGESGEEPSLYSYNNPLIFSEGVVNQAAFFPEDNRLQFLANENINDLIGTIHYWINTSWLEPAQHCLFSYGYGMHFMKIELTEENIFRFTFGHDRQNMEVDVNISMWEPDSWHHIAHTWNKDAANPFEAMNTYFDGELAGFNEYNDYENLIQPIGGEFQIGADGAQNPLMAKLDLFSILDYQLSDADIRAIYEQHIPLQERHTLLLDFENSLLGNSLEEPSQEMGVRFAEGKFGLAIHLNPQDLLKYPYEGNINPKKGSIFCWVFPNWDNNNDHTLFQVDDGSNFLIGSNDSGEFLIRIGNQDNQDDQNNQEKYFEAAIDKDLLPQQTWTHLTFIWNYRAESSQKALQIYVNGELTAQNHSGAMPWNIPSISGEEIQIAGNEFQNTFSGKIDRFFILDFIPDQQTISDIQNGGYPIIDDMVLFSNSQINLLSGDYLLHDNNNSGVIILENKENISIDGSNVTTKGETGQGIFLELSDCEDIVLTNFESIQDYFVGFKLTNCKNIEINNCNISANMNNTDGAVNIWDKSDMTPGGGILLDNCQQVSISDNILTQQNTGIAAYACDNLTIEDNNCTQNSINGIRMFHSNNNQINRNNCSSITSDNESQKSSGLLLYFCRQNSVTHNNFSFGGNGIVTNDNARSDNAIADFDGGNNYFAYNDCSRSMYNAVESVFSTGNIFEYNTCSFSKYGFWLGYSKNLRVNNNIIKHNRHSGIAIERGSDNSLIANILRENRTGMEIWQDDSPISGYNNFISQDYEIAKNYFIGNHTALLMAGTENAHATQNLFITNWNGVILEEFSSGDTLKTNRFSNTVRYHIINRSDSTLIATENSFGHNESELIDCKILDYKDGNEYAEVIWEPFIHSSDPEIQTTPPPDLAEKEYDWISFSEDGLPTIISWDSSDYLIGKQALHVISESSTNVVIHYTPSTLIPARWDLNQISAIVFNFKIKHISGQNLQQAEIFLGDECNSYIKFMDFGAEMLNDCENWTEIRIPIEGNAAWQKSTVGGIDLSRISYFELLLDSWGNGVEFWLDGVSFEYKTEAGSTDLNNLEIGEVYPNPAHSELNIEIKFPDYQFVEICLRSILGKEEKVLYSGNIPPGKTMLTFPLQELPSGIYILETHSKSAINYQQLIINQQPYR